MSTPFSQQAVAAATKPVQVPAEVHPAAETDIYRTFSPSEIAYWDFKTKPDSGGPGAGESLGRKRSSGGLLSRIGNFFGGGPSK